MIFILSKILLFLIKPFFWCCSLLVTAFFIKSPKLKRRFFSFGLIILLLFSNGFIIRKVYNLYEPEYPKAIKNYDVAIVLGGFSGLNKRNNDIQFNRTSDRLFQTISLYRKGKIRKILIAGGNADLTDNQVKEADLVKVFLHQICIPDSDVFIENQSRNTIENAKFSRAIIDKYNPSAKVIVVTSAWHIPRAKLIFDRTLANKPDYLPTNYNGEVSKISFDDFVPEAGAMSSWDTLFKEWIGLAVDKIRS
ncbi:MAG: YdcF family protein [Sphingobacteriales bacterium]|nr:MAG: YdcF family protein [Sphingobacteriales bacterium]